MLWASPFVIRSNSLYLSKSDALVFAIADYAFGIIYVQQTLIMCIQILGALGIRPIIQIGFNDVGPIEIYITSIQKLMEEAVGGCKAGVSNALRTRGRVKGNWHSQGTI